MWASKKKQMCVSKIKCVFRKQMWTWKYKCELLKMKCVSQNANQKMKCVLEVNVKFRTEKEHEMCISKDKCVF